MSLPKFVVTLWDIAASDRGRNSVKAIITDARDIGVSSYANDGGEMFFTIPYNHPKIAECQPWLRHYEVKRLNSDGTYGVAGVGLLDDYETDANETIVYGRDYLSLFDLSISGSNTSHTSQDIGSIIQTHLSVAIFQPTITTAKSITRPIALGTIDTTSQTVTVLTSYQSRLQFIRQLVDIWQSDSSVRPIVSVTRSAPLTVSFQKNAGSDKSTRRFAYGGLINDFRYSPGFADFKTRLNVIGQKREGAALLFSESTYADESVYGLIQSANVILDVVDQASLDRKTKRAARNGGTIGKKLNMVIRNGQLGPWEWGELADSIPVTISRGIVNLNGTYTVWGQEWIGKADGSEDLFLSVLPKET